MGWFGLTNFWDDQVEVLCQWDNKERKNGKKALWLSLTLSHGSLEAIVGSQHSLKHPEASQLKRKPTAYSMTFKLGARDHYLHSFLFLWKMPLCQDQGGHSTHSITVE